MAAIAAASILIAAPAEARAKRADADAQKATKARTQPKSTLKVLISIASQRLAVYDGDELVAEAPISSGRRGYSTPTGVFSILQKRRYHESNIYSGAPMPFMQRLTWSGIALHAGHLPGYPASHGCIRLPHGFASKLFSQTALGGRVIVSHERLSAPQRIEHAGLIDPLPPGEPEAEQAARPAGDQAAVSSVGFAPTGMVAAVLPGSDPARRTMASVAIERKQLLEKRKASIEQAEARHAAMKAAFADAEDVLLERRRARAEIAQTLKRIEGERQAALREIRSLDAELSRLARRAGDELSEAVREELAQAELELERREQDIDQRIAGLDRDAAEALRNAQAASESEAAALAAVKTAVGELHEAEIRVSIAVDAHKSAIAEERLRVHPISVLISRKTGKIHVRQGFSDVLEAPVTITQPEWPLGTHVFTANALAPGGGAIDWTVVTVAGGDEPVRNSTTTSRRRGKPAADEAQPAPVTTARPPATPAAALSRVSIPEDVRSKLAELVKPGSSIVISDLGPSHETGRGTDFVLLTR